MDGWMDEVVGAGIGFVRQNLELEQEAGDSHVPGGAGLNSL